MRVDSGLDQENLDCLKEIKELQEQLARKEEKVVRYKGQSYLDEFETKDFSCQANLGDTLIEETE